MILKNKYPHPSFFLIDASGNPVTQVVISVTDSSGNVVTGNSFKPCTLSLTLIHDKF